MSGYWASVARWGQPNTPLRAEVGADIEILKH